MAHGRSRGTRQRKHWHRIPTAETHFTANGTALMGVFSLNDPATVLRMLGEYVIEPTGAVASSDAACIGVGIGLVSSDSAELGATAVPDPIDEADFPWLYWAEHAFHFADSTANPAPASTSIRKAFDVRSMRKMKPRESLVFITQYFDLAGAPPLSVIAGSTRVLFGE